MMKYKKPFRFGWMIGLRLWWEWIVYLFEPSHGDVNRLQAAWCRYNNHPAGVYWYNPSGWEPDMHCKYCGDDLG